MNLSSTSFFANNFKVSVPGKWVLAGEHAVIRGGCAVALPCPKSILKLEFCESDKKFIAVEPASLQEMIPTLIDEFEKLTQTHVARSLNGLLKIESNIPVGAGQGSSAALCVAVVKWLGSRSKIPESELIKIATRLEDHFHGTSSGMDVATCFAATPIEFYRERGARPLGIKHLPNFEVYDTGLRSITKNCVSKVVQKFEENPVLGKKLDSQMSQAAQLGIEGLEFYDKGDLSTGLNRISNAMKQAQNCFEAWGLVPPKIKKQVEELYKKGALAVKLTGSGEGGFLIALWPDRG